MLRLMVSRPVCLGISTHLGLTTRFLLLSDSCWFVDVGRSLWREDESYHLQLLLALASADIFGSDSHGTRDHNLLSQIRDLPIRRLLRLAGLRWRYLTLPPHGLLELLKSSPRTHGFHLEGNSLAQTTWKTPVSIVVVKLLQLPSSGLHNTISNSNSIIVEVFSTPLHSNSCCLACFEVLA
jgi:hypothetical protein